HARAVHAEAGQRAADDRRLDVLDVPVAQAELRRLVAAQVREDGVALAHKVLEDRACVGVAEVERDASLVAVEGLEVERALVLLVRRHVAADVAARRGILALDHLGAEVCELQRSPRARAELLDREDAQVGERGARHDSALRVIPAARPRSTTERAILREASSIISPSKSTAPSPASP